MAIILPATAFCSISVEKLVKFPVFCQPINKAFRYRASNWRNWKCRLCGLILMKNILKTDAAIIIWLPCPDLHQTQNKTDVWSPVIPACDVNGASVSCLWVIGGSAVETCYLLLREGPLEKCWGWGERFLYPSKIFVRWGKSPRRIFIFTAFLLGWKREGMRLEGEYFTTVILIFALIIIWTGLKFQ